MSEKRETYYAAVAGFADVFQPEGSVFTTDKPKGSWMVPVDSKGRPVEDPTEHFNREQAKITKAAAKARAEADAKKAIVKVDQKTDDGAIAAAVVKALAEAGVITGKAKAAAPTPTPAKADADKK